MRWLSGRDQDMPSDQIVTNSPSELTENEYDELVQQGRSVIKDAAALQFKLGDLALKIDPIADDRKERSQQFHRFADDLGIKFETLAEYRRVAIAWPEEHRATQKASYSVHRMLAGNSDRFEIIQSPTPHPRDGAPIWTYDNAARAVKRQPSWPTTPAERVKKIHDLAGDDDVATEIARDFLKRPAVVSRVVQDDVTRHLLDRARVQHGQRQARKVDDERTRKYPAMQDLANHIECIEILGACTAFVAAIHRLLPHVLEKGLADADRRALEASLRRVGQAADWCQTAVATGYDGLDRRLEQLLDEGSER